MAPCTIWAMTRQPSTIARPNRALTIAPLALSIWRGLPLADMYLNPPHIRKKAQTVTATPSPMLSRWVNRLLIASTLLSPLCVAPGSARCADLIGWSPLGRWHGQPTGRLPGVAGRRAARHRPPPAPAGPRGDGATDHPLGRERVAR